MHITPIPYAAPLTRLAPWAEAPYTLLFDGCDAQGRPLGRYSYLCVDPFEVIDAPSEGLDPFAALRARLAGLSCPIDPRCPPFQGGVAGLLGYELGRYFERLPRAPRPAPLGAPMVLGLYDVVIAWDHAARASWIVSTGLPAPEGPGRDARAAARAAQIQATLAVTPSIPPFTPARGAPWRASASPEAYAQAVQKVIDYIHAGDLFQANLSLAFEAHTEAHPLALYRRLSDLNPAPHSAFMRLPDGALLSASPERFLSVDARGEVRAEPIKGTRPRGSSPEADAAEAAALLASDKDRAENVMIVDLLRNDLSRVCAPGTVAVPQLCALHTFASVHHLISTITGRLSPPNDALDLLAACFPGGSITGAPKIRAMEIITELEGEARGPYCGALIHLGFDGQLDSSLLIRTLVYEDQPDGGPARCVVRAGGGIVADSSPAGEHEEAQLKARRLKALLEGEG
ncbi:aminodeoxychorismate synthase component I [Myxococcota bacterium]|nr:aminodeoxychorismate synthase component I [Myxococcota bacterium]